MSEAAYVPGVCNINTEEIAQRRKTGHVGTLIFVIVLVALLFLSVSRYYRVILFFPAFLAGIGYLQARNKFCVGYAAANQQNADEGSASASDITNDTAKAADKAKAHRMNLQVVAIALAVTIVAVLIPHL